MCNRPLKPMCSLGGSKTSPMGSESRLSAHYLCSVRCCSISALIPLLRWAIFIAGREEGDPAYQQGKQVLDFLFRQTVPFTLQPSQGKRKFVETNPEHKVENFLGITRASGDIQDNQKPRRGPKSPY